jgi:hypothetical protein
MDELFIESIYYIYFNETTKGQREKPKTYIMEC